MINLLNRHLGQFIGQSTDSKQRTLERITALPSWAKPGIVHTYLAIKRRDLNNRIAPDTIYFFITNRCNMRCDHCFYLNEIEKGMTDEMSLEEIQRLASSLAGHSSNIAITGGEPLVRKDLGEVILAFHQLGNSQRISIATNGFYRKRILAVVEQVLSSAPDLSLAFQVSLDGPRAIHDKIRRLEGSYDKACETILDLKSLSARFPNLHVSINGVVSRDNADVFPKFHQEMLDTFDVPFIWHFLRQDAQDVQEISPEQLLAFEDSESFSEDKKHDLLPDDATCQTLLNKFREVEGNNLLTDWRLKSKEHHLRIAREKKRSVSFCVAPYKGCVLFSDGQIGVCEVLKPVNNVRHFDMDLPKAWKSATMEAQRRDASKCYCTYPCNLLDSMLYDSGSILSVVAGSGDHAEASTGIQT